VKRYGALGFAACAALLPAAAHAQQSSPAVIPMTFTLAVKGALAPHATFWVSYGPLAGHFGIARMRRVMPHTYTVTLRLPLHGRTTFYYLAGQGSLHTRAGLVPGNPVVTVKQVGPTSVTRTTAMRANWRAPIG
jgi:hypothetical protein